MTISSELDKLKLTKTSIRKVLQRKGTGLTLSEIYPNYYTYIRNMSDTKSPDENSLIDYVEDRVSFLELTVNKIRPFAFRQYTCLQGLYLNNSQVVTLENLNAFSGITPTIYVPSNLVNSYKAANNWSSISNRIKAYTAQVKDEMYLIQHINHVQTISWLSGKTIGELNKDFR